MKKILDKHLIYAMGIALLLSCYKDAEVVAYVLVGLIFTELSIYIEDKRWQIVFAVLFAGACFFFPLFIVFTPIFLYEVGWFAEWKGCVLFALFLVGRMNLTEIWQVGLWFIVSALALRIGYQSGKREREQVEFLKLKDAQTEFSIAANLRTKELLERQDYEVQMATLQERNRIAREIHDNVGHMLSRTILQTAALLTICKEEPLHSNLESINQSLNEAMNNIRESVHDLHDESLDLRARLLELINPMKENYTVSFDYDMTAGAPRSVKYCFLSIVKEALTNVEKHSDASKIMVVLREHPGFYQMMVEDNGSKKKELKEPGIGLINMKERVDSLNGTIHFSNNKGFRIMVTIPRGGE